jgi:hypothetical protein
MSDMSSIIKPVVCEPDFEIACRKKPDDSISNPPGSLSNLPENNTPSNEPEQLVMRRIFRGKKTYALS